MAEKPVHKIQTRGLDQESYLSLIGPFAQHDPSPRTTLRPARTTLRPVWTLQCGPNQPAVWTESTCSVDRVTLQCGVFHELAVPWYSCRTLGRSRRLQGVLAVHVLRSVDSGTFQPMCLPPRATVEGANQLNDALTTVAASQQMTETRTQHRHKPIDLMHLNAKQAVRIAARRAMRDRLSPMAPTPLEADALIDFQRCTRPLILSPSCACQSSCKRLARHQSPLGS